MTDYTLCFWKVSALVPFKSRQDIYFHSLQRSPEWKIRASLPPVLRRKCCSWKWAQIPSWQLAMKTPILMYFDKQSSRPDSLLPQSIGTMHTEFLRSLKRIANEKQSWSEKKPQSHVGSQWSSSEVVVVVRGGLAETGKWVRGGFFNSAAQCVKGRGGLIQSLLSQLSPGLAFFGLSQPSLLPPP